MTHPDNTSGTQASGTESLYLKVLVPHEVQGFLDLSDGAGTFPAEVCGCPPVEVVCALLIKTEQ